MKEFYSKHGAPIFMLAIGLCLFTLFHFGNSIYNGNIAQLNLENQLNSAILSNSIDNSPEQSGTDSENNLYLEIEALSKAHAIEITRFAPEKLQNASVSYTGQELDIRGSYTSIVELINSIEKRGHNKVNVVVGLENPLPLCTFVLK